MSRIEPLPTESYATFWDEAPVDVELENTDTEFLTATEATPAAIDSKPADDE